MQSLQALAAQRSHLHQQPPQPQQQCNRQPRGAGPQQWQLQGGSSGPGRRPAPAATGCAPALLPAPVLERGCAAASLSRDKLSKQQQDYLCNYGAALRALQQDLPVLLERQPCLDIFCEGVVFQDHLSPRLGLPPSSCSGKEAYRRLLWSLRFHRALFFCKSRVELLRLWEREPGVVCVRWSARASPRLLDGLVTTASAALSLDGMSEFHFNDSGRIMKHRVDCVSYSGPSVQVPLLARYARPHLVPGLAGGSWDEC